MAKYKSPFQLSGSIGPATFALNNGTHSARIKQGMSTRRWKTARKLRTARNQSASFGPASRLASLLHSPLDHDMRRLLGPHYHNRITRAILAGAPRIQYGMATGLPAARSAQALRQLDLGHLPPEGTAPIASTQHHTLSQKVTVHGLRRLRDTIPLKKGELLEFRILTAHLKVPAATAHPNLPGCFIPDAEDTYGLLASHTGQWQSHLDLPEVLTLPAPHIDNTVLIVAVEWRAIQGRRVRYLPQQNVVRIAAAHVGTRPKDLPWLQHRNPKRLHTGKRRGPNRTPSQTATLTPMEARQARTRYQEALERTKPRVPIPAI